MSQDVYIDPADQFAMQHLQGATQPLQGLKADADANEERKQIVPPSECVMGAGAPFHATVAFVSADPKKRWKYHTEKNGVRHKVPFFGAQIQYTLCDTPNGMFDGLIISEYVMTMVTFNGTCGTQGLLQAIGVWDVRLADENSMMNTINAVLARSPKIGIHTDWEGQHVIVEDILGPDGKPAFGPDGKARVERHFNEVPGLDSWRAFMQFAPPDHQGKIPPSRIEVKDPQGNPRLDAKSNPIVWSAKANVTRRECLTAAANQPMAQGFGAGPQTQQGFAQPFGTPAPNVIPFGAPPQQQYAQAQPQPQPQQPQQQYQQQQPQPAGYPQQQPLFQQPAAAPQPAMGPYQPPQPTAPWQDPAPAWVTGQR